jgi:hypothetical protein
VKAYHPQKVRPVSLFTGETSLLRRLQAQTLPDATPPIVKIHPFSKFAITFKPLMLFDAL